ncbi:MAG: DNA polymerase III subunit beta [Marinilabiliales bacterium]|nr:MAG: DNA polymerase III subunit beta [Marinilabiliales bacterium]
MKFIISSTALLRSLQKISGVLSTSNTLPILEDFLFELKEGKLKITASDLETTISVELEVDKFENEGVVAIPAKMLLDIMKTFPEIPVTISVNLENQGVEIFAGEGKYKLIGHKSDEFPQIPILDNTTKIDISGAQLVDAFNKTLFATGNDELRPVMSGVLCELSPENITFVATDAHKLVRYRRHDLKSEKSDSFILPKKPLNHLKNIIPDDNDAEVKLEYNESNAVIIFDNITLICRLIEGKYPNYEAVIPQQNPFKLSVARKSLLNALKRVSIFGSKSTHQVRFKVSGKELVLSAEDIDYSSEARERLTCSYEGDDIEIGFNSKFMLDMLATLDNENIIIEMSAPNRAGILLPDDKDENAEDILMLIMPVMLSQ